MHELFLTTSIPHDGKNWALRILQGYCGMNPDPLVRRRLIWQGPRRRNLPGVNPKLLGNQTPPKMALWKTLHEQLVRQSYVVTLLYDVQRDQFSHPVTAGSETRSAGDGPYVHHPFCLQACLIPDENAVTSFVMSCLGLFAGQTCPTRQPLGQ